MTLWQQRTKQHESQKAHRPAEYMLYENLYSPQMVERTKTNNNIKKKLHEKTIVI